MNCRKHTALLLTAAVLAACSQAGREEAYAPDARSTRVTLQREGADNIAVYAFRQLGDKFLFDTLFREGWTPEGTLSVRMPGGRYKFLFAGGAGDYLALRPAPERRRTAWEETAFSLREDPLSAGRYLPADELFLQYPAADAEQVYTLGGRDLTIPARLTRAVCQIGLRLKRGYNDGTGYVEIPYTTSGNILDEVARIGVEARGTGLRVRPDGVTGTATISATLEASDYTQLTDKGFVLLDGPCILPPAEGADIDLTLSVTPAASSHLQAAQLELSGKAERNKRLEITLWITADYPDIGIEIDVAPIDREQEGDSGVWE